MFQTGVGKRNTKFRALESGGNQIKKKTHSHFTTSSV
jgi:hypothetical protein